MKKVISLVLIAILSLSLAVSCGKKSEDGMSGVYKADSTVYAFIDGGVVAYNAIGARFCTYTVEGDSLTIGGDTVAKSALTASSLEFSGGSGSEYFVTSVVGGAKTVTALTEAGKAQTALVIPHEIDDIAEGVFEGSSVKAIVIPEGSALNLSNGSLKNGGGISVLISGSIAPGTDLTCGNSLLDGTSGVTFYIEKGALSSYKSHYAWGLFKDNMKGI